MPRPLPTTVVHFTHVSHLVSIVQNGLVADSRAHRDGLLSVEVGNIGIKERRQRRAVPIAPGGVVADYVPFYFAPRSPMMFVIHKGGVPTYSGGCDELVYLVSTVEAVAAVCPHVLFTDRNAVLELAAFDSDLNALGDLVDWPLMRASMWANTADDPDRKEHRMAECLVHAEVPWSAFSGITARSAACARTAQAALDSLGSTTPVSVRSNWYF